jgi:hypothetical protein
VPLGPEPIDPEKGVDWNLFHPLWSPDSKQLAVRDVRLILSHKRQGL